MFMQIKYNPEITLGNLLTIFAFVGAVGAAYMDLLTNDTKQERDITYLNLQIDRVESVVNKTAENLESLGKRVTDYQIDLLRQQNGPKPNR